MPTANGIESGHFQDSDRDKDRDFERDRDKGSKNKSAKAKDLSHVPCKFFKVGACTAGSSCPFSHNLQEPGAQKEVCAWYVKGNCKFGHKCALAHILPGQSMSMDRKNKKAAQAAANAAGNLGGGGSGKDGGRGGKSQKRDTQSNIGSGGPPSTPNNQLRNPLLSGSTAPTRVLPSSSRPPLSMPLKASISPSAPAPPLQDTDFASFGLPDENNKLLVAPAQARTSQHETLTASPDTPATEKGVTPKENQLSPTSSPLPLSTPSAPRRLGVGQQRSPDFGPIGSPPRSSGSAGRSAQMNGFSPSTPPSQNAAFVSSSPFSAPGVKSAFLKDDSPSDFKGRSGIAASLGANRTWKTDYGPVPPQVVGRVDLGSNLLGGEVAVEDEDLEDFLPGSLTDLLTPEERSRRLSRSNSGQPMASVRRDSSSQRANVESSQHRYSRSVPAPSLLGDLKSIWADSNPTPTDANVSASGTPFATTGGLGSGTPSSYKSSTGFGSQPFNEDALSPPLLSPTNASAAFLPGLHHHYLNSKTANQRPPGINSRSVAPAFHSSTSTGGAAPSTLSGNTFVPTGSPGVALSPSQMNAFGNRPRFENAPPESFANPIANRQVPGRPIPGGTSEFGGDADERSNALSPSTRALQAHAPGQSLPQGLAAGYSRIHALPPPPVISSPSGSSAFGPGHSAFSPPGSNGHEWSSSVDYPSALHATSPNAGLDSMFSRLSYPVTTPRVPPSSSQNASSGATAPGMVRNVSGRTWQSHGPFSPLSGPVVTGDDDDLFSMDG